MKKFISLLLILVLSLSITAPGISYAATIKLNKSKLQLTINETFNLKLNNTTKKATWSSSNKSIVKVSMDGKIKAINVGQATITAKLGSKKYTCKVTVKYDVDNMIVETYNWVVGIWNDSFCDIYHYLEDGYDSYGQKLDIGKSISNADKYMSQIDIYDDFIDYLRKDDYYSDLTNLWDKTKVEVNYLYGRIKDETPTACDENYDFNYHNFQDYMYEFMDIAY
jgi:hypothetical protein